MACWCRHVPIALILGLMNDFMLKAGHLGYDAVRLGSCLRITCELVSPYTTQTGEGRKDLFMAGRGLVTVWTPH